MALYINSILGEVSCKEKNCDLHSFLSKRKIIINVNCQEPARDIPLVTKVMRKGARHTQRRDRASGVPPDIL